LTPDLQLKLFGSLVTRILLYCCEVWGFKNIKDIEKVHLTFCKPILGRFFEIVDGKQEKQCSEMYHF